MSTTKAISPSLASAIDMDLVRQHLRLDETGDEALLALYLTAAWSRVEKYCNRIWGPRVVETTFGVGEPYELPEGSGPATAVRGLITSLDELPTVGSYWQEYVKGIVISRDYPIDYQNLPTYTVTHTLLREPEPDVTLAILKLTADFYENRESSLTGQLNRPLAISYQLLLNPYRITD